MFYFPPPPPPPMCSPQISHLLQPHRHPPPYPSYEVLYSLEGGGFGIEWTVCRRVWIMTFLNAMWRHLHNHILVSSHVMYTAIEVQYLNNKSVFIEHLNHVIVGFPNTSLMVVHQNLFGESEHWWVVIVKNNKQPCYSSPQFTAHSHPRSSRQFCCLSSKEL